MGYQNVNRFGLKSPAQLTEQNAYETSPNLTSPDRDSLNYEQSKDQQINQYFALKYIQ